MNLGGFLSGLRRIVPHGLLGAGGRILAIAGRSPLGVIDQPFGFEFALKREAADADFCVCVRPGSTLASHYIREGAAAVPGSAAAALGACLAGGEDGPASFLSRKDGGIILEYDLPDVLPKETVPGVFFVPRDGSRGDVRKLHDDPEDTVAALWAAAAWSADTEEMRQVRRVYETFPGASHVVQAGVLPGRRRRAVRLVVHRVDAAALPRMLERLRWTGSRDTVMSVIAATEGIVRPGCVLSLDVDRNGVSPRLGLEMYCAEEKTRAGRAGWRPIIDRLADRRWCLPAKADGLRTWPRAERLIGRSGIYSIHSTINHMKVVVEARGISAKAYIAVYVRPSGMGGGLDNEGK